MKDKGYDVEEFSRLLADMKKKGWVIRDYSMHRPARQAPRRGSGLHHTVEYEPGDTMRITIYLRKNG